MFSYNKLLGKMAENGYTQKMLANKLGISENSLTNKIKERSTFNSLEIATICNLLGIPISQIGDIFFTPKV